jgi:hypothetical protein
MNSLIRTITPVLFGKWSLLKAHLVSLCFYTYLKSLHTELAKYQQQTFYRKIRYTFCPMQNYLTLKYVQIISQLVGIMTLSNQNVKLCFPLIYMSHHCEEETHNTGKPEWISCHDRRSFPLIQQLPILDVSCSVVTLQCWPKSCRPAATSFPLTNIEYNRKMMRKYIVSFLLHCF